MARRTIKQLESVSDVNFAIAVLNDKAKSLTNVYSPLAVKIKKTIAALQALDNLQPKPKKKK